MATTCGQKSLRTKNLCRRYLDENQARKRAMKFFLAESKFVDVSNAIIAIGQNVT